MSNHRRLRFCILLTVISQLLGMATCFAATTPTQSTNDEIEAANQNDAKNPPDYEDDNIRIRLIRRSPKQIAAFYEGRQFPKSAVDRLSQVCFVAAIIRNKTREILWLDLSQWQFKGKQEIKRLERSYWKQQWQQADVDRASQATFGWTLLPEQRDLQPDEGVGGNITLPLMAQEFSIIARFDRGQNRTLPPIDVTLSNVTCKQDP